ncbi:kinase-like domain-containing protein [Suillus clintonianus]|uniref:kinase-like domain-containing protein n=1 Tax=Suillus clintonianus TaxID=1904413 RepID=UPI001B87A128|nr:kinase-like domain-containing protein [Suillus clintonianus]KAG2134521.1 kinase-like domain-containing protein [Suillus clintonianus]
MGNCYSQKSGTINDSPRPTHQEINGIPQPPHQEINGSPQSTPPVNFKIKPRNIPATEIKKLQDFASGTGGLGDVWMCSWSPQSQAGTSKVAVKAVRVPQANDIKLVATTSKRIRREAYVWITLEHDNILTFSGVVDGFGPLPSLVSPWMENGSLDSYLKRGHVLSKTEKLRMLRQMAAGLKYLHDKGVVHGDLTCTNVLIDDDGKLHLADFGLSMILTESQNTTFNSCHPGNARWMAPEMLATPEEGKVVMPTKAADVYSYGCIMLQLFCGHVPYHWLTQAYHVIGARLSGTVPFRQFTDVEDGHKEYSLKCISVNVRDRPEASGIVDFLGSE